MSSSEQGLNLSQVLIVLVLGGLAVKYFFFSSAANPGQQSRNAANNVRAREADVERIQQMFPQVARRSIMWDLQRNGGNVVATTERVLSGRGLEVPPQSFQPPLPTPASSSTPASSAPAKPAQPDLITRYNLKAKLAEEASRREAAENNAAEPESVPSEGGTGKQKQAWSANKVERQTLLQTRREEMILKARRQMEAKLAAERGQGGQGGQGS